jgi:signal peptidase I
MVDKVSYMFHAPARGDVIVFVAPPAPTENYVKRIIALPGDVITVNSDTDANKDAVILNGVTLNETYVAPEMQGNPNPRIVNKLIPENQYFVMGDDRKNSSDSRVWGLVSRDKIIGRAALVYWPLGKDNTGFLPNVSPVFANVNTPTNKVPQAQPDAQINTLSAPPHFSTGIAQMALAGLPSLALPFTLGRKRRSKKGNTSRGGVS